MANYLTFIAGSDIDYFYEVEDFLGAGDACLAKHTEVKVGGCIINAASICSSLSSNVKVIDYLKKDDEGTNKIVNTLKDNNIDTSYIKYDKDATNGSCLIMKKDDEKCIYVLEPNRPYYNEGDVKDLLFNSKYIYTMMHTLKISFKDLDLLKQAKNKGVQIIFDGCSQYINDDDKNILFDLADGFFMNKSSYTRLKEKCEEEPINYLLDRGLKFAVITDGSKGATLYLKNKTIHEDSKKVNVIDSTGAGDCFAGTFLHYLDEGLTYEEALKYASYAGALACTYKGGIAPITKEKLEDFIKKS